MLFDTCHVSPDEILGQRHARALDESLGNFAGQDIAECATSESTRPTVCQEYVRRYPQTGLYDRLRTKGMYGWSNSFSPEGAVVQRDGVSDSPDVVALAWAQVGSGIDPRMTRNVRA